MLFVSICDILKFLITILKKNSLSFLLINALKDADGQIFKFKFNTKMAQNLLTNMCTQFQHQYAKNLKQDYKSK